MEYYKLADEEIVTIQTLYDAGQYRHMVTHACMCMEYLLKTKLVQIDPNSDLLYGHDIVNIFKTVQKKHKSNKDLSSIVKFCRKYLNDSRYPAQVTGIYTQEFAKQFIEFVEDIKNYIDNECCVTVEELTNKFGKNL